MLAARAPDDVWAVGGIPGGRFSSGGISHWDGDSWQRLYATSRGVVTHVGGSARDDAWFTIQQGSRTTTLVRWDGNSFTDLNTFDGSAMGIGDRFKRRVADQLP